MSGVGSSRVPKGQVRGDSGPGIDTPIRWVRGLRVPTVLTGRLALLFWGAPKAMWEIKMGQSGSGQRAGYTT